jgi:DNA-directed RNA polymerase specialized sigma24 family protein
LLRAVAKEHLWEPGTNLRGWLFAILHNQHINDVRRSIREEPFLGSPRSLSPTQLNLRRMPVFSSPTSSVRLQNCRRRSAVLP